jgi:hypothetical protein
VCVVQTLVQYTHWPQFVLNVDPDWTKAYCLLLLD